MKVLITGSSGLIGQALLRCLSAEGHEVRGLSRNIVAKDSPHWNPEEGIINLEGFSNIDVVIHLAGDSLVGGRWNEAKKSRILTSRVKGTELISEFLAGLNPKPKVLISASAIGFYGDCGDNTVDENSERGTGFLAEVCHQWEGSTKPAMNAGIRVVNIRTGMVLSSSGGALKKMRMPFKLGLGGIIGSGRQYMSWVSIEDVCQMIQYVMTNDSIRGPVNLVSPHPVSNQEFTKNLGQVFHRPTIFPLPAFMARLIFGSEMANELLLSSARVVPQKLIDKGYVFRHSELEETLKYLLTTKNRK